MAYVASSDFIEYANVKTWDSDVDETRWTGLIARATSIIETYTDRVFEATTDGITGTTDAAVTRKYDAIDDVDGYVLYLDKDICEITTVTNGDAAAVASSDYVTEPRNDKPYYAIRILNSANKTWTYTNDPENAISIAGVWTYSITPPNDIKHACLRLTKWLEDQRKTDVDLDRPVLAGEGSVILPMRLPADVISILEKYKRTKGIVSV